MDQRPYQVMDAKGCWIKEIATLRRNVERFYLKGAMSLVQKGRFFMPFFSVRINLRSSTRTLSVSTWALRVIMSHGSAKYIPYVSQYSRTTMYDSMCTVELEYCIHLTPHTPPYCENERNDFLSHVSCMHTCTYRHNVHSSTYRKSDTPEYSSTRKMYCNPSTVSELQDFCTTSTLSQ